MNILLPNETFGLLKTHLDTHTLGISMSANLLRASGCRALIAGDEIARAVTDIKRVNNFGLVRKWIVDNGISRLGFSYRLDPLDGKDYFLGLYHQMKANNMFAEEGGVIRGMFFAGLPETCEAITRVLGRAVTVFPGGETAWETLRLLGVPPSAWPREMLSGDEYDNARMTFARKLLASEEYLRHEPPNHSRYPNYGASNDLLVDRIESARARRTLPLIRAHVGPYHKDARKAVNEFIDWTKTLAKGGYLDVLSIGTSQLTQSRFGEVWGDAPNGGGVPLNSPADYERVWEAARPMLARTYAGTKNVPPISRRSTKSI